MTLNGLTQGQIVCRCSMGKKKRPHKAGAKS
jgi:hypothetical protein